MYARYLLIIVFFVCFSCTNEFFPEGLYDYQVERLLSGGDTKVWQQVADFDNCADSVRLLIELIPSTQDDSLTISEIFKGKGCNPDTTLIGNADASSFVGALLFTDSLNFTNGDYWIIEHVSSSSLTLRNKAVIRYTF